MGRSYRSYFTGTLFPWIAERLETDDQLSIKIRHEGEMARYSIIKIFSSQKIARIIKGLFGISSTVVFCDIKNLPFNGRKKFSRISWGIISIYVPIIIYVPIYVPIIIIYEHKSQVLNSLFHFASLDRINLSFAFNKINTRYFDWRRRS